MKRIPLTQEKFAIVDDIDFDYLSQWTWFHHNGYAERKSRRCGKQHTVWMHRVVAARAGLNLQKEIDHKNQNGEIDGLNNQRYNLRSANRRENVQNQKPRVGTSSYKGVDYVSTHKKWRARIKTPQGVRKFLGYFDTDLEAAIAYNNAAKMHFGEFAYTNQVTG